VHLGNLKPKIPSKDKKRVGRGGKRGTYSGKGQKGQKSRAGASIKPGFRGGDNRVWQLFPKLRGASKKPGGSGIYPKHRFYQLRKTKPQILNIEKFNIFQDGTVINPKLLYENGFLKKQEDTVKILGNGKITKKLIFEGFILSKTAREKILKAGGSVSK
jgi:large subunit ribosomal protein L15